MDATNTATIANFDDERLIREGEAAATEFDKHLRSARHQIIPMARGLLAARRKYPADIEFGRWFDASPYAEVVTNHSMRAALINIAEHEEIAAPFIRYTNLVSPVTIWQGVQELLDARTILLEARPVSQPVKPPLQSQEPPEREILPETPADSEIAVPDEPAEDDGNKPHPAPLHHRHSFFGFPRGDELATVFLGGRTRQTILAAMRLPGGTRIWKLILLAYDGGLIPVNRRSIKSPNLALLCPVLPLRFAKRFDLTKSRDRGRAEELLPQLIALKDQILANPGQIETLLVLEERRARAETAQSRVEAAVATLPPGECEIVMFGQRLWPRLNNRQGEYSFRQICAAIWFFSDFDRWSRLNPDNSVGSRAVRVRLAVKWFIEFSMLEDQQNRIRPVLSLVQWLSRLLEDAPEAICQPPPYPNREGEW